MGSTTMVVRSSFKILLHGMLMKEVLKILAVADRFWFVGHERAADLQR